MSDIALLTGAGFTANFGGPLATDMTDIIYSRIPPDHTEARGYMTDPGGFEALYRDLEISRLRGADRSTCRAAVHAAYSEVDDIVMRFQPDGPHGVEFSRVEDLLSMFGKRTQPGLIFTLNQDLFLERQWRNYIQLPRLLGFGNNPLGAFLGAQETPLAQLKVIIPGDVTPAVRASLANGGFRVCYVKLHGSCNWHLDNRPESMLVIGGSKLEQIESVPLLRWYLEVFRDYLCTHVRKLLVIGYGFCDDHINRIIVDAVEQSRMELWTMAPMSVIDMRTTLRRVSDSLRDGLTQHIRGTLADVFPSGAETSTRQEDMLSRDFFQGPICRDDEAMRRDDWARRLGMRRTPAP